VSDYPRKIKYRNYWIVIDLDTDPISPRELECLGTMVCAHQRHRLGDRMIGDGGDTPYLDTPQGFRSWLNAQAAVGKVIFLPLYLYDHGMLSISTESWMGRAVHAEWDSGLLGFIYTTRERIAQMTGWKRLTGTRRREIVRQLKDEVENYDKYLVGDVFGYTVYDGDPDDPMSNDLDSCWGYYDVDEASHDARSIIDYYIIKQGQQLYLPGLEMDEA